MASWSRGAAGAERARSHQHAPHVPRERSERAKEALVRGVSHAALMAQFFHDLRDVRIVHVADPAEQMMLDLKTLPDRVRVPPNHESVVRRQISFGYTEEELRILLTPMAASGGEPLGSMGTDTPTAVLSQRSRPLYDYFVELFAQVTNPPLDAIREEVVTSMRRVMGPEQNLLEPNVGTARFWRLTGRDEQRREAWEGHRASGVAALGIVERQLAGRNESVVTCDETYDEGVVGPLLCWRCLRRRGRDDFHHPEHRRQCARGRKGRLERGGVGPCRQRNRDQARPIQRGDRTSHQGHHVHRGANKPARSERHD